MKTILSILIALALTVSAYAQTITTKQGDSFSALLVMDSTYTLANLKDLSVYVNNTEVARKSLGTITTTNVARAFKMSLTSATMRRFQGNNSLQVAVYDSLLGVKRTPIITLVVTASSNGFNNTAVNTGVDATININVTSLGVTSNVLLATVMKGDPGAGGSGSIDTTLYVRKVTGYQLSNSNYTSAEKSKLAGIASGATSNSTDAQLRDRSTHTGTQANTTITGLGTSSTLNVPASGNAASGEVVKGNDTRLSDSRTPTTHSHAQSEVTGLTAALAAKLAIADTTGLLQKTTAAATYQAKGNYLTGINSSQVTTALGYTPYNATNPSGYITSSALSPYLTTSTATSTYQPIGTYLVASDLTPYLTTSTATSTYFAIPTGTTAQYLRGNGTLATFPTLGTSAALNVAASGDASSLQVVKGNDTRLSDARTPTTHSHAQSDVTGLVSDLSAKQATLVSGTNIKTINGTSLLGSGDITVSGGGDLSGYLTIISADTTYQPIGSYLPNSDTTLYLKKSTASGLYQPIGSYLTGINSGQVTTALGYTPYNATNPNSYITASAITGKLNISDTTGLLQKVTAAATYQLKGSYLVASDLNPYLPKSDTSLYVQKVSGWGLSQNSYTTTEKSKLAGIAAGAEVNVNADWSAGSGDSQILNKPTLGTAAALNVATSGNAASGEVVKGNDSRLTDSRTPTSHTHTASETTDFDAAVAANSAVAANTAKVTNATHTGDVTGSTTLTIASNVIVDADINSAAAIDATKVANGTVTNAEFQYIGTLSSNAQTQIDGKQPLDSDLTTIAGLTPTSDNFIYSVAGAWASRTVAQVKSLLAYTKSDISLGNVENTALSTWAGSSNITTLGTVTSGTFSGSFGAVSGANLTNLTAGNLSGTIPSGVLGNSSLYIGTTATALNRASANQALTGISSVTLPGSTSGTIQIIPAATAGTGTVFTLPATTGTAITTGDVGTVTNTMLAGSIATSKITGLGTLATQSGTFSGTSSGTNTGDQTITLTGDITGSGTGSFATTIGTGVIVNADINASAAIGATKLIDGSVTDMELGYINTLSSNAQTQLDGKQPLDSDLTTLAGLAATTDNFIYSVGSAWASRTPAQVRTTLALVPGTDIQAYNTNLATIASLTATTDNFIVSSSSAWASRTPSQVRTTLGLVVGTNVQAYDADLDDLADGSLTATKIAAGALANGMTATTQSTGDNSTKLATTAYVDDAKNKTLESIEVAFSDETTAITTGTAKVTFYMPYAMTVTEVFLGLTTAQSSGSIFTVDINEAGTTILSTKLTVDNTESGSNTAATAAVVSDTSLAKWAKITIDVDQSAGTATGGKVIINGYRQ